VITTAAQLADNGQELESVKGQLSDGQRKLAALERQLAASQQELSTTKGQLVASQQEVSDANGRCSDSQQAQQQTQRQLADSKQRSESLFSSLKQAEDQASICCDLGLCAVAYVTQKHDAATLERHSAIKMRLTEQQNHSCQLAKAVSMWWRNCSVVSDAISLRLYGFAVRLRCLHRPHHWH